MSTGSMGGGREENTSAMADLDTLIEDVVASVRGLLYVCGAGPSTTGGSAGGSRENGVIAAGGGGGLEALVPKIMVEILAATVAFTLPPPPLTHPHSHRLPFSIQPVKTLPAQVNSNPFEVGVVCASDKVCALVGCLFRLGFLFFVLYLFHLSFPSFFL
ncbi:hypothetical protein F5879DRAFT_952233 [Lentinula edodes]|nr:hypothetical protein F5879DRAFT_952233 [Lentinula edodes]